MQLPTPRRCPALPAVLVLVGLVGGCAGGGSSSYPSLASRPAERLPDVVPSVAASAPAAAGVPSADLAARLQGLVDDARSAHRDFARLRINGEKQICAGRAAAIGSEDWARATQALSGLESARSRTAQPLSDLDRLEINDRLAHPAPLGGSPDALAVASARDIVAALVAEEDEVLAKLDHKEDKISK